MLIGVDTSGKIGQGNLFTVAVVYEKSEMMNGLRKRISKRHPGLANRRRIKASDLKKDELEWLEFGVLSEDEIAALERFNPPKPRKKTLSDWIAYLKLFLLGMKQSVKDLFVGSSKS